MMTPTEEQLQKLRAEFVEWFQSVRPNLPARDVEAEADHRMKCLREQMEDLQLNPLREALGLSTVKVW